MNRRQAPSRQLHLSLVAGLALLAGNAAAATYPKSTGPADIRSWLESTTDVPPQTVLALTNSTLIAVTSNFERPNGARLVLRAEGLSPDMAERLGALSWTVAVDIDCAKRQIKAGETVGYIDRNLLGASRILDTGDTQWRTTQPGTPLESAWRAVCDPAFRRPFASLTSIAAGGTRPTQPSLPQASEVTGSRHQAAPTAVKTAPSSLSRKVAASPRLSIFEVQVGAFDDRATAEVQLARLRSRVSGADEDITPRIQQVKVGGRTVFRALLSGFRIASSAEQFCAKLKTTAQDCFVRRR